MTTTRNTPNPFPVSHFGRQYVETVGKCPGCDQLITVVLDSAGLSADYSECGGEGEGGCTPWIDGDQFAQDVHTAALQAVNGLLSDRAHGTTSCKCEVLAHHDIVLQPVGECPWHGDEAQAYRMMFTDPADDEDNDPEDPWTWANPV